MHSVNIHRRAILAVTAAVMAGTGLARARSDAPKTGTAAAAGTRALREMSIHRIAELGLEIWIENQPAWDLERVESAGRAQWAASSPEAYHPPAAIVFASWPDLRGDTAYFETTAGNAIRRGSLNFGLTRQEARQIRVRPARYGVLEGFEGDFPGTVEQIAMDVKIFVGRQPGRFPVALTVYTLRGKLAMLSEVIRRGFTSVKYL